MSAPTLPRATTAPPGPATYRRICAECRRPFASSPFSDEWTCYPCFKVWEANMEAEMDAALDLDWGLPLPDPGLLSPLQLRAWDKAYTGHLSRQRPLSAAEDEHWRDIATRLRYA